MHDTGLILDSKSISGLVELAQEAEDAGFHSVWTTELYRTSFQQLTPVACSTSRVHVGTAVALAFVRSPFITALTALDLDEISSGRLILGLGTGAKRANELWHGVSYGKPTVKIRECIEVIRLIIDKCTSGEPILYNGEYYSVNIKGYHRPFKPVRGRIPIYLAGVGKYMTRTAAEVADGYIGHVVCSLRYIKEVVSKSIELGLNRAGKDRRDFKVASIITCAVSNDKRRARQAARATIAFYATVRTYEPPFKLHGFEKETMQIREAFLKGDVESMIQGVSDDMIDAFAVVGTPDECRKRIKEYMNHIDLPILSAPHYFLDFEEVREYQRALLNTFGR
ncbi:MAG: luciferase-like protein [Deltaproteobacteria bacterium]|jgi:probable F420-dependent oxidoreductase|nr:MAG: luciferase-like protein [Deltaproteobacteria bacterium]